MCAASQHAFVHACGAIAEAGLGSGDPGWSWLLVGQRSTFCSVGCVPLLAACVV